MNSVVSDMHTLVRDFILREEQAQLAALEAADFEERFTFAEDDRERQHLCRRWLRAYTTPVGRGQGQAR